MSVKPNPQTNNKVTATACLKEGCKKFATWISFELVCTLRVHRLLSLVINRNKFCGRETKQRPQHTHPHTHTRKRGQRLVSVRKYSGHLSPPLGNSIVQRCGRVGRKICTVYLFCKYFGSPSSTLHCQRIAEDKIQHACSTVEYSSQQFQSKLE